MLQIIIDSLLFILLLLEYSRVFLPPIIHEIIGILLIILVIIHLILNKNYLKTIRSKKYNTKTIIMLIINLLLIVLFILTMTWGLLSSHELLPFMNLKSMTIIHFHKIIAYYLLITVALHLGLNFSTALKKIETRISNKYITNTIYLIIIICGLYSVNEVNLFNHLIGSYGFSITTGNLLINLVEYICIILMITVIFNKLYNKL